MTSATDSPATGELPALRVALQGQYSIERELGRGGMGIVVLARDERLDRQVALKVLPPSLAEHPETRERFLREARMAAQLSHPNIVPVYRADEIGGFAFFAMGFVDGETLGDRVRARGTLPPAEVVRVLREVAWALAYAHARGIVHRDVKPENILIERGTGRAVVTDFGIARSDFNPALTQDGLVLGTVHYMSPEQSSGETLDGRSDLYALGCVGFLALSGRLPFEGASPQAVLIAHATKEPPSLQSVAPHVPAALAAVIDRCLYKRADDRFATGEELAEALGKTLGALEENARDGHANAVISSDDAMAVWRRAAELQAEAASRLETRMRDTAAAAPDASLTDAYRLRDVEAAAAEVGISQRHVALALAELRAPDAIQRAQPLSPFMERLATRLFGTTQRTLSVSRVFRFSSKVVLQAVGRTLHAPPYSLVLRDTLGGHPLDGGVLVFDLPRMTDGNYRWTWTRYGVYVPEVRVTFASVPNDPRACEVSMHLDLRRGLTANIAGFSVGTVATSGVSAMFGALIGVKGLALAGAALLGPAFGAAVVVGGACIAGSGKLYRWELVKTTAELEAALAAVEAAIRAMDIFGDTRPNVLNPLLSGR